MSSEHRISASASLLAARALYSWQRRLLRDHLIQGDAPDAIDIPTGLGKTTVIALWLAALAHGAPLPRRLVYVVDRRAVVDQATAEADSLARVLGTGRSADAIVIALRGGLGLGPGQVLPVSTLRGQHADNRLWLAHPALPAIVVGTVDMIGSRLLFSGYGVSRRLRPMHAGLLGVDALVVLDEAHLVPPFESLVRQIHSLRRLDGNGVDIPSFRVMALSATGRTQTSATFRLNDEDLQDQHVKVRLDAPKRLRLLPEVSAKDLPDGLASRAWDLSQPASSVLVFCNSRKTATEVAELLSKRMRDAHGKDAVGVELLVGERRVLERQRLVESDVFRRFRPRGSEGATEDSMPAFLVATSAGEVGVDLDADHAVCDLVPWERMVQRLGRVNRRSEPTHTALVEVIPVEVTTGKDEGETAIDTERLRTLRAPFEHAGWPPAPDGLHDVSAGALYRLKENGQLREVILNATTSEPLGPELTMPLVHAWAMTSLPSHSGRPEVQPWIRGWLEEEAPQTRVAWRRWFPLRARPDGSWLDGERNRTRDLQVFFDEAAPHLSEILEAPTYRTVAVLKKRAAAWLDEGGESKNPDTVEEGNGTNSSTPSHWPVVIVLSRDGEVERVLECKSLAFEKSDRLHRLLAGRTAIVDARLGGLTENGLLDASDSTMRLTVDRGDGAWPHLRDVGFRVRQTNASAPVEDDWRIEHRWPFDPDAEAARTGGVEQSV